MSRIDRTRVVGKDEEELDEFICSICLNIFEEPVVTQCCEKTYCKECINLWWEDHNNCPNCREILRTKTARKLRNASRNYKNLLNKLKIKCENYGTHCQSVLTIEEMANHLKKCNFCDSCKTSQKLLSDNKKQNETLESEVINLKKLLLDKRKEIAFLKRKVDDNQIDLDQLNQLITNSNKTSQKLLSDNKKENESLKSEVGRLKTDLDHSKEELLDKQQKNGRLKIESEKLQKALGQSKDELSNKQMEIKTFQTEIEQLRNDLDQSYHQLRKLKFYPIFAGIEVVVIKKARSISTPIKDNIIDLSEEEVEYLTNLAKSALSESSFVNISELIYRDIANIPGYNQFHWVIKTDLNDRNTIPNTTQFRSDKCLRLIFNDITIVFKGYKRN